MFEYVKIKFDGFVVSPSSIATFMDNPKHWYKSHITKEECFQGNTSSVLGNVVHELIKGHYDGSIITDEDIQCYLDTFKDNDDVDTWVISDEYRAMFNQWKQEYVPPAFEPKLIENQIQYEPIKGYCIGGSVDALFGDTLVDWKTTGSNKSSVGDYKYQLLTYAYILRKTGIEVNNIQTCYIKRPELNRGLSKVKTKAFPDGKPLEDKPSKITVCTEPITDEDMQMIEEQLKLIVKTVKAYEKDNSLADLLFRSNPLSFRQ